MTNAQGLAWAMALDYAQRLNAQFGKGNFVLGDGEKHTQLLEIDIESQYIGYQQGNSLYEDHQTCADVRHFWTTYFEVVQKVDWLS